MRKNALLGAILLLAFLAVTIPAGAASIQFGVANTKTGGGLVYLTNEGDHVELDASDIAVTFTYQNLFGTPLFPSLANDQPVTAYLTLHAESWDTSVPNGSQYSMGGFKGYFDISFSDAVAAATYGGLKVLLHGTFDPTPEATMNVDSTNGTAGSMQASASSIQYTSDFITLGTSTEQAFSFSFIFNPGVTLDTNSRFNGSSGTVTGLFSSDPAPNTSTPEPATLGLIGSALIGLGVFARKRR